jgi:hypothetical protein
VKATVVYITGRPDPRLDWTLSDLDQQIRPDDEIHLIVVDALDRTPEKLGVPPSTKVKSVVVTPPKPNIWQGRHRVTAVDWWAKSSASNTGIVLCETDYIAFLDDRCRLGPKWLETVRVAESKRGSVIVGSYDKQEDGRLTIDHRRHLSPNGARDCGGKWLYGCTFALPLEWCLEVNGFEEGCDGLSAEDYTFGFMLENSGRRIDFVPALFVTLERTFQHGNTYLRMDKGKSPDDKSHAAKHRFCSRKRTEFTPDLRALRETIAQGGTFPIPDPDGDYRDWYDGSPIRSM